MEAFIVTRKISIIGLDSNINKDIARIFKSIEGINLVEQKGTRWLIISYDLTAMDFEDVKNDLSRSGVELKNGIFQRLRYAYWTLGDQNMKDNLKIPVHCCNKAPK